MMIPTLTSDPMRFSAALARIERRQARRERRRTLWRGLRRYLASLRDFPRLPR